MHIHFPCQSQPWALWFLFRRCLEIFFAVMMKDWKEITNSYFTNETISHRSVEHKKKEGVLLKNMKILEVYGTSGPDFLLGAWVKPCLTSHRPLYLTWRNGIIYLLNVACSCHDPWVRNYVKLFNVVWKKIKKTIWLWVVIINCASFLVENFYPICRNTCRFAFWCGGA